MKRILGITTVGVMIIGQSIFAAEDNKWESTVAAGLNITSGNSETTAFNAGVSAEKSGEVNEIRLGLEGNYGESTVNDIDDTTTQNAKALAVYKRKYEEFFLYSDNSLFHNKIADIDSRLILGLGGGRRIVESDNIKLDLELGLSYIYEDLTDVSSDDYVSARVAARYEHDLSQSSKLWLSAEYMPNIEDIDDYLANGEAGIEAAINETLSLRVVVQDRYDSTVPATLERNDLSVVSSLVYTL
jgi:putative salt-induced outer membrane protein YdiY